MHDTLTKLLGWKALLLYSDILTYDRWIWLKRYLEGGSKRTFDAGSGNGVFAIYAAKIGNESIGMSFDREANRKARLRTDILDVKNVKFIDASLDDLDKMSGELGAFDQIICLEVIEHIVDDEKLIKNLSGLLKPSGKLFLTTPYKYNKGLYSLKVSKDEKTGHVREGYTHAEIKEMFDRHGLSVVSEGCVGGFISQKLTSFMYFLHVKAGIFISRAVTLPLRMFQLFDPILTKLIGHPYFSIGVVGIKHK